MRFRLKNKPLRSVLVLCLLVLFAACRPVSDKGGINWQPGLSEKGNLPYDCRIARESLPYYFPQATIQSLNKSFRYSHMGAAMWADEADSTSLLILAGLDFFIGDQEWADLKAYIAQGHEVLLFCSRMDELVEQDLRLRKLVSMEEQPLNNYYKGTENRDLLYLSNRGRSFGYQGRSLEGYFELDMEDALVADTTDYYFGWPEILGTRRDDQKTPNFLRFPFGDGHLTLHAAPLVLSNYFLLQGDNRNYLDGLMHQLPPNINRVYWQSYHRRQRQGNELSVLWRHPATRWAILLAVFTLLLYVLFEMKRRQRIIPVIPRPENTSVQFATTIGQLYFHQQDHRNLAVKMWQHFQDWLRQTHNLETPAMPDRSFARRLEGRTGQPAEQVTLLLDRVQQLQEEHYAFGEHDLRAFYSLLQSFYTGNAKKN